MVPVHSSLNCHTGKMAACIKRNGDKKNIYVIGDSHATNIVPSIRYVADKNEISTSYFLGGG